MKKILPFFLLAAGISTAQDTTYNRVYSHQTEGLAITKIAQAPQKGIMAVGTYKQANGLILSIDSSGTEQIAKQLKFTINDSGNFRFESLLSTSDGNFFAAGSAYNTDSSMYDGWCLKFDAQGDTLWSRSITNPENDDYEIRAALETYDNKYAVSGNTIFGGTGFIAVLDEQGDLSWSRTFSVTEGITINALAEAPDHSFYLSGHIGFNTFSGGFIIHLSEAGIVLWAKQYFDSFGESLIDADGNLLNYILYPENGIVKTDPAGDVIWSETFPGILPSQDDSDLSLISINDSTYAALQGNFYQSNLIIFNTDGEAQELHSIVLNTFDMFMSDDNGLVIAGKGPLHGIKSDINRSKAGIIKTDSLYSSGSFCMFGPEMPAVQEIALIPSALTVSTASNTLSLRHLPFAIDTLEISSVSQCMDALGELDENTMRELTVYPNISGGQFSFHNDQNDSFSLVIVDALGKTAFRGSSTGETTTIDLTSLGSGIYFYKALFENGGVAAGKLVISK